MRHAPNPIAVLSIAALMLAAGCSSNEKSTANDCAADYSELKAEVRQLTGKGDYQAAQDLLADNESCFKGNDKYWGLRVSALPKNVKAGSAGEKNYSIQAVNYLDKAIKIAPDDNAYYVFKAYFLIAAKQVKKGVDLYDEQLDKSVSRFQSGDKRSVADALLIEDSDYYIYGANQAYDMQHAIDGMSPYLGYVCSNAPRLRKRYAASIIAIKQVFDGNDNPVIPKNENDRTKALDNACSEFGDD